MTLTVNMDFLMGAILTRCMTQGRMDATQEIDCFPAESSLKPQVFCILSSELIIQSRQITFAVNRIRFRILATHWRIQWLGGS